MSKYKLIVLCGEAGSGKDSVLKALTQDPFFHNVVTMTTRPPREKEEEGKDYYFTDLQTFTNLLLSDQLIEAAVFNGWGYGTPYSSLVEDKINVIVLNPQGIKILKDNPNLDLTIVYLVVNDKERLLRQLNREENPDVEEIIRRFKTDKEDFDTEFFNDYVDLKMVNEDKEDLWEIVSYLRGQN